MEILQEIGSYAGLAAVLGLAVLSALYFSQARDVKRLREWAGRAPERAPETTGVQRVAAKPVPRAPGQAAATQAGAPAAPGAKPVPPAPAGARAAAAGAAPATAVGPAAATPAARAEAAKTGKDDEEADATGSDNGTDEGNVLSQDTVVHPPPPPPGEDDDEYDEDFDDTGDHEQVSEEDDALDDDGDWDDTGEHDPTDPESHWEDTGDEPAIAPRPATPAASRPIAPGAPVPAAGTPTPSASASTSPATSSGGSILPPYAHSRPGGRAPEGGNGGPRLFASRGRAIAVVAAGVLVLGGIALGATQLLGGDDEPAGSAGGDNASQNAPATETTPSKGGGKKPPLNRGNVRVAVLNGTTVPGLAAQIGDQIERQGFRLGTVTNFNDQQRAESVVLYAPGAEREAAEVGRRLKISQREPIDAESQG
ncbi:MAG TPA: LytR C-terminal domain-containing protein, partial [Thermoleophilaceae bacterium]|nr:LytR C-terminal domain-containing protein [Thermoleophilaceae bacterium]